MTDEQISGNLASMAELAKANGIRVIFSSILPVSEYHVRPGDTAPPQTTRRPMARITALNAWMKEYAASNGHVYLDYFAAMTDAKGLLRAELSEDDLHPNAAGYAIMAPLAEAAIQAALRRSPMARTMSRVIWGAAAAAVVIVAAPARRRLRNIPTCCSVPGSGVQSGESSAPTLAPVATVSFPCRGAAEGAAASRVDDRPGEPDPPGRIKGLEALGAFRGRALTYAMAFLLTGDRRYRDAAVAELDHAITQWPIWVDTAHPPLRPDDG